MTKDEIIETLSLIPHPSEGGYFRRTYESPEKAKVGDRNRMLMTSIYYLLTDDSPIGYLHRNRSDILHYYHLGSSIRYWVITLEGELKETVLGPNLSQGEVAQFLVKGGEWKASELCCGTYGLISEAVCPGFDYEENEIAKTENIALSYPELMPGIAKTIKPDQ